MIALRVEQKLSQRPSMPTGSGNTSIDQSMMCLYYHGVIFHFNAKAALRTVWSVNLRASLGKLPIPINVIQQSWHQLFKNVENIFTAIWYEKKQIKRWLKIECCSICKIHLYSALENYKLDIDKNYSNWGKNPLHLSFSRRYDINFDLLPMRSLFCETAPKLHYDCPVYGP